MTRATVSADGETINVHIPLTFRTRGGRKLVVAPDGGEVGTLLVPIRRKPPKQIIQLQLRQLTPVEDRLHDLRREQRMTARCRHSAFWFPGLRT